MAAAAPNTGGGNQVVLSPNISPLNIAFKGTVQLFTVDQNNNNAPISEGYNVTGPTSPGMTPLVLAGGEKVAIPLTTSSAAGAPYLKIHYPTSTNGLNKVYITYCVSNAFMADGFYDYTTGVPTSYMNALRNWINTNPATGQPYTNNSPTLRVRSLKFVGYGSSTNKPANAVTFFINIQGTFAASFNVDTEVVGVGSGGPGNFSLGG